jgi:hypothetical protein
MIHPRSTAGNALQVGINLIIEDLELNDEDIWDLDIPEEKREIVMQIFMDAIAKVENQKILNHIHWLTARGYTVVKEDE